MMDTDNSVLELEIANLLNRSNARIPLKRTTVRVRVHEQGRHSCRIEISGEMENCGAVADFEDFLVEGFFLRAEKSLALQLQSNPVTDSIIATT